MLCCSEGLRFAVHTPLIWARSLRFIPIASMLRRLVWDMSLRLAHLLHDVLWRLEEQVKDIVVNSFETH